MYIFCTVIMLKCLAAPLIGLKGKAGNKLWDYSVFCVKKSHLSVLILALGRTMWRTHCISFSQIKLTFS